MEQAKKPRIPRGSAANAAKRRYNEKTYDRVTVNFRKENGERVRAAAAGVGKSTTQFIVDCVNYCIDNNIDINNSSNDK